MATIELSNIAHTYEPSAMEPVYALEKLNLAWTDGGTYALLGPSGCGKTTMLNIISGLVRPSQGQVLFDQVDFTDFPHLKTKYCPGVPVPGNLHPDERRREPCFPADLSPCSPN